MDHHRVGVFAGFISALVFLSCATQAYANMKEIKAYKEAFPGATVKCAACHSVAMPKKEAAGLNSYGQAVIAANPKPTAETFKQLGEAENFKK
jgi:cobalamin synthase